MCMIPGLQRFSWAFSLPLLSSTLPAGPSASEVTTLWRYTNMFINIIIIIIITAKTKTKTAQKWS